MTDRRIPAITVEGRQYLLLTDEQRDCYDTALPAIRAVLNELLPEHADLAHELALVGCVAWRTWEHDPDDLEKLKAVRATVERLEQQYRALRPATRGAVNPPDMDELLGDFKASLDGAIDRWPRRPRQRPPNAETDIAFHLWDVLRERGVEMRPSARCIAAVFILLGTVDPATTDHKRLADSIYQRIRNATVR